MKLFKGVKGLKSNQKWTSCMGSFNKFLLLYIFLASPNSDQLAYYQRLKQSHKVSQLQAKDV